MHHQDLDIINIGSGKKINQNVYSNERYFNES